MFTLASAPLQCVSTIDQLPHWWCCLTSPLKTWVAAPTNGGVWWGRKNKFARSKEREVSIFYSNGRWKDFACRKFLCPQSSTNESSWKPTISSPSWHQLLLRWMQSIGSNHDINTVAPEVKPPTHHWETKDSREGFLRWYHKLSYKSFAVLMLLTELDETPK